ncbi:MAG: archaetidylserine decarboxylase [Gammaproteobacteria bacterium]
MDFKQAAAVLPQYLLPHHPLSRLMGVLTHSQNKVLKNWMIGQAVRYFHVDMDEAQESDIDAYPSFSHFFTRALKPDVRPIDDAADAIVSPADGTVSQAGGIDHKKIIQAKGKYYSVVELLGGDRDRARPFKNGKFATIYLSPKDYHRLHMPLTGTLREMVHIPGRLFSVNAVTADGVPNLFARNERVAAIFDTEAGPMALVLVGAIFVASIHTVWHGIVTPPSAKSVYRWSYQKHPVQLRRGEEMGHFNMGSTVIVLFGHDAVRWIDGLAAGKTVKMGERIGTRF